jgi:hypothetical protein
VKALHVCSMGLNIHLVLGLCGCWHAGYALPPDLPVLYEEAGGFLQPEAMIQAHVEVARRHGATVHTFEQVMAYRNTPWTCSWHKFLKKSAGSGVVTHVGRCITM